MIGICAASSRKSTQSAASFAAQAVAAVAPCSSGSPNSKPLLGGNEDAEGEVIRSKMNNAAKELNDLWEYMQHFKQTKRLRRPSIALSSQTHRQHGKLNG